MKYSWAQFKYEYGSLVTPMAIAMSICLPVVVWALMY